MVIHEIAATIKAKADAKLGLIGFINQKTIAVKWIMPTKGRSKALNKALKASELAANLARAMDRL
jgi:hypothetical protein